MEGILNEAGQAMDDVYKGIVNNPTELLEGVSKILHYPYSKDKITLMEEAVLESTWEQLKTINTENVDLDDEIPAVVPYFTPNEYRDIFPGANIEDYDYIMIRERDKYLRLIRNLQIDMCLALESEKHVYREKLLKLGWNPFVEANNLALNRARQRQIRYLKETKPTIQFINLTNMDSNLDEASVKLVDMILEPVYICLSYTNTAMGNLINWWKKSKYSHSALSLDSKCNAMYSFNRNVKTGETGFFKEGIQDYKNPETGDAELCILAVFVTKEQKKKIKETIEWYTANKSRTSYSFKNIANIVFNRTEESLYSLSMVCSQFVDNVLKIANVDITGKANNLVSPEDFIYMTKENSKVYIVYQGLRSKYKPTKTDQKIKAILKSMTKDQLPKTTKKALTMEMENPLIESFLVTCTDDAFSENILREAHELLKPESILVEAKRIPIGFTKKGDFYIDTPKDLELEYQEAHKLLSLYDEDNINGIKHELARLFYIISICEKKMSKMEDHNTADYKDLVKLKARAMNDFSKYMKVVMKVEKNFDFSEYLKHTEYYNKTVVIGSDTLKYSGQYIKKALKMLNM